MTDPDTVAFEVARVREHWAGEALFEAWAVAHDRPRVHALLGSLREPGPIALRCRLRHLLDPGRPEVVAGALRIDRSVWDEVLALETRGDVLLRMGPEREDDARAVFERLRAGEPSPGHRVVTVNAVLGLADLARQVDDVDRSAALLRQAAEMAEVDGYRFGRMRALVSLGYLVVVALSSATAAAEHFTEASGLASEIGDRLFRANTELGLAECRQRLRDLDGAREHAERALEVFTALKSPGGVGNAASKLADILLHQGDRGRARRELRRAADAFAEAGVVIGQIGTLDLLGDLEIEDREIPAAVGHHRQAIELSEEVGFPRGRANGLAGLAHAARVVGTWPQARQLGGAALSAFRELGDPLGESHALEGLAVCAVEEGDLAAAVECRMSAVRTIESMRADLNRHDLQAEYRTRFAPTYRRAAETAVDASDPVALLWLLECLAGRRLAGLVEQGAAALDPGQAEVLGQLAARADQSWRAPTPDPWMDRRTRVVRKIGALAIGGTTAQPAARALEDLIANLYLPPPAQVQPLTDALPPRCELLLVEVGITDRLLWVHRAVDGALSCGSMELGPVAAVLDTLDGPDAAGLVLADLDPLAAVLPEALVAGSGPQRLLVVPVGRARAIPWTAVPFRGRTLGELVEVVVCPSLTVQRALRARMAARDRWPQIPSMAVWRHPGLAHHRFDGFGDEPGMTVRRLAHAAAAIAEIDRADADLLVAAAHGRPLPGGGHYLELDTGTVLAQADCIGVRPPRKVALVACWGGHTPGTVVDADPVSIASLLLAGGSDEVVATTAELGDSGHATRFAEMVVHAMLTMPAPAAVHRAVRRLLALDPVRQGPVRHWAPLQAYGTFHEGGRPPT